ncbi:MAG: Translation initiation factor 2 [Burkholderiaceae bacterium]|nr:MAG: Translation initiation factor 2 [Burkholderiaceae bacterium]
MAAAVALALGMSAIDAHAFALGRITVQSALGEPLRAQIAVPEITPEEAVSLRVTMAAPSAFKAAGLEYNPIVPRLHINLQRGAGGHAYLNVTSDRPINDPYLDIIIEANWSTGRMLRDYTMLFDPAERRTLAEAAPIAPQIPATPIPPKATNLPLPTARRSAQPPAPRPVRPPEPRAKSGTSGGQVTVARGDTAGRIAAAHRPANVSLDQMLVALLRANPDAFINGNVNRLKAGAVLNMPSAQQAEATPAGSARETIVAQSRNFNNFRRELAEHAPATRMATANRSATGSVQANVEEQAPAAASPDRLTLSKGSVQTKNGPEAQALAARKTQDANARVAELNKNVTELNKLESASKAAGSAPPAAAAEAPAHDGITVPIAAAPAASAPAAAAKSEASAAAATAKPEAPPAATAPAKPTPKVVPVSTAGSGFLSQVMDNPLVPAGAAVIIALLAGLGFYRVRQRRKNGEVDSAFLESRLQPDSFFGSSGGQNVDTTKVSPPSSSMVYSPSQLDAAGDVDPVAEADVYLAYGRDLQAEEILKEALRSNPTRASIYTKLLEIYAKRRDAKTFEVMATEAYGLMTGAGSDWEHVCKLGQELDPANPLYQPGGHPPAPSAQERKQAVPEEMISTMPFTAQPALSQPTMPVDLDLDFSANERRSAPKGATKPMGLMDADETLRVPMAHDDDTPSGPATHDGDTLRGPIEPPATAPMPVSASVPLDMDFSSTAPASIEPPSAASQTAHHSGMLEFDLNAISLDLDQAAAKSAEPDAANHAPESTQRRAAADSGSHDPLLTKLELAEEFRTIGDADGARALAEEVIAEASGSLKARAQKLIAELG